MKHRNGPPFSLALFAVFALLVGALLLGGFALLTAKTVTIVIDGVRSDVRTHQPSVAALLDELGLSLEAQDLLSLPGDTPVVSGLRVEINRAASILIEADGEAQRVRTQHKQPGEILAEAGLTLNEPDALYVDGKLWLPTAAPLPTAPRMLRIERAIPLTIHDEGQTQTVFTVARTVGEVLYQAGIPLYLADRITPPLESPIQRDTPIQIMRALTINIEVDGATVAVRSRAENIGAALAETGFGLVGLDYSLPPDTAPLTAGMLVRVVRVTEEDEISYSEIDYPQVFQSDTSLPPQVRAVRQPGIRGLMERRVRIRRENGVEVSRSLPQEAVIREPREEIIAVGATPVLVTPAKP